MIRNFFVLSPRGDTILAKQYRHASGVGVKEIGAHERSHTEALFRKIKFWNDEGQQGGGGGGGGGGIGGDDDFLDDNDDNNAGYDQHSIARTSSADHGETGGGGRKKSQKGSSKGKPKGDAPPVFLMPDGLTYFHVKRNGLIFGASTARNVSPSTVLEVRQRKFIAAATQNERPLSSHLYPEPC